MCLGVAVAHRGYELVAQSFPNRAVRIIVLAFYLVVFFRCYLRDIIPKMCIYSLGSYFFLSGWRNDKQLHQVKPMVYANYSRSYILTNSPLQGRSASLPFFSLYLFCV